MWKAIGSPPLLRLIELGPGRGTMMADALRALRVLPPLYQSLNIHLVEINPVLRDKQKATLSGVRNIAWHDNIDEVPDGPAVIFANEYFDVLPIHQVVKRETGWHERTVEIDDNGKLAFGAAPEPMPRFEVLLPPLVRAAPVGAVFEWRPDAEIMKIATRVRDQDGAALIIDYGHLRSDAGDTFQAIARHSFTDPLKNPGQADVTAHVDFQALVRAAEDLGARVHGPVPQGDFLKRLGIETRAVTLMAKATHEVSEDISGALKRLVGGGRGGMGSMFKVLAVSAPHLTDLAGFSDEKDEQAGRRGGAAMTLESPLLSAIPGLRHAFFTREGGVSGGVYGSLNGGVGSQRRSRPMSRKTAAGWRSRWASARRIFSACGRPIRPMSWWRRALARRARGRAPTPSSPAPRVSPSAPPRPTADRSCSSTPRARDRCGACGMEGRADRHSGIHRRRDGKTRRRARRHRRRHRPADPPALLRSRRRIRRTLHRGRRGERAVLHSLGARRAMRCSTSPASSGCGSKTPACS